MADRNPKRYRAKFIEPGIISYEDISAGKVFVSKDALDRMMNSFVGKPVINEEHIDLEPEQSFKLTDEENQSLADGVVSSVGYDSETGWYYADMIIWNEDTKKNIDENGYSVSCAYVPNEVLGSGKYHGIDYDEEVVNGVYTHMAIVENPRYEASVVYENSKKYKTKKNSEVPKEEPKMNAEDSVIEIDGQQIPLTELIKVWEAEEAEKAKLSENKCNELGEEDEIEVGDKKVKGKDLVAAYRSSLAKSNAEGEGVEKANAEQAQDVKAESVTLNNAKAKSSFVAVKNAAAKSDSIAIADSMKLNTREERFKRGAERYGSKVEVK
jgi:hypothetical protein